jgi:hypothetical protein
VNAEYPPDIPQLYSGQSDYLGINLIDGVSGEFKASTLPSHKESGILNATSEQSDRSQSISDPGPGPEHVEHAPGTVKSTSDGANRPQEKLQTSTLRPNENSGVSNQPSSDVVLAQLSCPSMNERQDLAARVEPATAPKLSLLHSSPQNASVAQEAGALTSNESAEAPNKLEQRSSASVELGAAPTLPLVHTSPLTVSAAQEVETGGWNESAEKDRFADRGFATQPLAVPPAKKSKKNLDGITKRSDKGTALNSKTLSSLNATNSHRGPESLPNGKLPGNVIANDMTDFMSDISTNSADFILDPSGSDATFLKQERRKLEVPGHILPPKKPSLLPTDPKKSINSKVTKSNVTPNHSANPQLLSAAVPSTRVDHHTVSHASNEASDPAFVLKSIVELQDEQMIRNAMQSHIDNLKTQLKSAQDSIILKDSESKELKKELKRAKKHYESELIALHEAHEREVMQIKSDHASEISSIGIKSAPRMDGVTDTSIGNVSLFVEQLDRVKSELNRQMQKAESERQAMLADQNDRIAQMERNYKNKSAEDRAKLSEYEKMLRDSQDKLAESMAREEAKTVLYAQLETRYQDTLSAMTKMKNDFASSLKAANSRSGSISSGQVETESQNRKSDMKLQSELRQLQSKIDFLQSQLEAEQDAHADVRRLLESKQKENDELRHRFQTRLQQLDAEKKIWVEETEQRIEQKYAEKLGQQTDLQVRFFDVQNQLQVAMRDLALVRQKEEEAQLRASKSASREKQLRGELENAKRLLEDFQMKNEIHFKSEMTKQSRENNMRKLENENEYLKTQMSDGEALRAELEMSLLNAQDELATIRVESSLEIDKLKTDYSNLEQQRLQQEQHLSARIINLEMEESRLKSLCSGFRSEVELLKDEVRNELTIIEEKSLMLEKSQDELRIARDEINSLHAASKTSEEIWQNQLSAMRYSLQQQQDTAESEIRYLKSELQKQVSLLSESQKSKETTQTEARMEKNNLTRKLGALHMLLNLRSFKRRRLAQAFDQWQTGCLMHQAGAQHKAILREELIKANEDNKQDLMDSIAMMDEGMTKEWQERMRQATLDHTIAMKKVRDEAEAAVRAYKEELSHSLAAARSEHESLLAARERSFAEELAKQEVILREEFASQMEKYEALLAESNELHKSELSKKDAEFAEKLRAQEDSSAKKLKESVQEAELVKETALNDARRAWEAEMSLAMKLAEGRWEEQFTESRNLYQKELAELEEKFESEKKTLLDTQVALTDQQIKELSKRFEDRLNEIQADVALQLHQQAEVLDERHRADLQKAKDDKTRENELELQDLRVVLEVEFKERIDKLTAKFEARAAEREEEFKILLEDECSAAEQTEAGKWQQVIKEIEERHKVDLEHSRQLGWNDRNTEALNEEYVLKAQHRAEVDGINQRHSDHIKALKAAFESDFAAQAMDMGVQRDAAIQEAIAAAAEELRRDWEQEVQKQVRSAEGRVENEWAGKLAKEHELTEKLRVDITKITQSHAIERANLQHELEDRDEKMMQLDEQLRDEMYSLRQEHQRAISELKAEFERTKQVWTDSELKPLERRALGLERDLMIARKEFDDKSNEAEQVHKNEMQEVTKAFQAEISKLRLDNKLMSEDIEKATQKIVDLEDAHYDFQQKLKKKDVEISIRVWQANALALRKQAQMKKEFIALEKRSTAQLADTKFELVNKLEGSVYCAMELAALISKVEAFRDGIRDRITKYKTDVLAEKRNKIKMVEVELDRILHEKSTLEDERQDLLDEIEGEDGLEAQVVAVEDDIREHSMASSVIQNGRLSVSHAKKKKRLDNELEQLLEIIDKKREECEQYESRIEKLEEHKSEKEAALIDLEKELVQVLIDQQRSVLALVDEGKALDENAKSIVQMNKFDWPPIEVPKQTDVRAHLSKIL